MKQTFYKLQSIAKFPCTLASFQNFTLYKVKKPNQKVHTSSSFLMSARKQFDLLYQFKVKCRQNLGRLPDAYFQQFFQNNILVFDISTFKFKDIPFAQILLALPFRQIHLIQAQENNKRVMHQANPSKIDKDKPQCTQKITKLINEALLNEGNQQIRVLKFRNVLISEQCFQILSNGIQKTKYLKELTLQNCNFKDQHLEILQNTLSLNVSLTSLHLSFNKLKDCGQSIVRILAAHGERKNQIAKLYMNKNMLPQFEIANTGIHQVNLEGNQLTHKSLEEIIAFLQNDQWVISLNLKNNNIDEEGITKFADLISQNSTLMNLDLRENPGFAKKYSKPIFLKLKQNIENMKLKKDNISPKRIARKQLNLFNSTHTNKIHKISLSKKESSRIRQNSNSFRQFNKQPVLTESNENLSRQKLKLQALNSSPIAVSSSNLYPFQRTMTDKKLSVPLMDKMTKKMSLAESKGSEHRKMNKTALVSSLSIQNLKKSQRKMEVKNFEEQNHNCQCQKCKQFSIKALKNEQKYRQMQLRALKAEKEKIELEIELKKLRNFLTKNMDVSAIGSSSNRLNLQNPPTLLHIQNSNISTSFNRLLNAQTDDDMLSKIELMVLEMTKIMETVELFQNTENTIEHPFENVNSFSKTVSLYEKPQQLIQIQQEILEDENLHLEQFGASQIKEISEKQETYESILRMERNDLQ